MRHPKLVSNKVQAMNDTEIENGVVFFFIIINIPYLLVYKYWYFVSNFQDFRLFFSHNPSSLCRFGNFFGQRKDHMFLIFHLLILNGWGTKATILYDQISFLFLIFFILFDFNFPFHFDYDQISYMKVELQSSFLLSHFFFLIGIRDFLI